MALIREISLRIGPLREDEAGAGGGSGVELVSDGGRSSLEIGFSHEKTIQSSPNKSEIVVKNLSRDVRDQLRTSLARVSLSVGYQGRAGAGPDSVGLGERIILLSGGLEAVQFSREGPDIVSVLTVLDGQAQMSSSVSSLTFVPGTRISEVVRQLARNLAEIDVGEIQLAGEVGPGGLSVADRTARVLDRLAGQYGFSWSVQNGQFLVVPDGQALQGVHEVSDEARNLISVTPLLDVPGQTDPGVQVEGLLNPSVRPGDLVNVQSGITPGLNGRYRVNSVGFAGGSRTNDWIMSIKAFSL